MLKPKLKPKLGFKSGLSQVGVMTLKLGISRAQARDLLIVAFFNINIIVLVLCHDLASAEDAKSTELNFIF